MTKTSLFGKASNTVTQKIAQNAVVESAKNMLALLIFGIINNKKADLMFFTDLLDKPYQAQLEAMPQQVNDYLNSIARINNFPEEKMSQIYRMAIEDVENRLFEAE